MCLESLTASEKAVATCFLLTKKLFYLFFYVICRVTFSFKSVFILLYHSVDANSSFYAVNPKEFKRQMEYLRRNCTIVSLDDIMNFVNGRKNLPKGSVAITFDDGYYDNYLNVYPYLKKHGLPATLFITTEHIGKEIPLGGVSLRALGWNEIKEMSQNNVAIGAHTMTHVNLNEVDLEEARDEIWGSKKEIGKKIGKNVIYFAYPSGRYTREIVDLVKSLDFKGGFSASVGAVKKAEDPYLLNRITIDSSISYMMFKVHLTKAVEWYKLVEQTAKKVLNRFPFMPLIHRIYVNAR